MVATPIPFFSFASSWISGGVVKESHYPIPSCGLIFHPYKRFVQCVYLLYLLFLGHHPFMLVCIHNSIFLFYPPFS